MEEWRYHKTYSGTIQGRVVSPILANIALNELDRFVDNELLPEYTQSKFPRLDSLRLSHYDFNEAASTETPYLPSYACQNRLSLER